MHQWQLFCPIDGASCAYLVIIWPCQSYFFKSALFSCFACLHLLYLQSASSYLHLTLFYPKCLQPLTFFSPFFVFLRFFSFTTVLIKNFTVATSRNCDSASNGLVELKIDDFLWFSRFSWLFYKLYPAAGASVEVSPNSKLKTQNSKILIFEF